MMGNRPYAPVPMTIWRHPQGISSSYRKRSVAELLSKFLRRLFLALADFAAINDDIMFVRAAVNLDGTKREFAEAHTRTPAGLQAALFFDVIALKADRHCPTSLLPQCGQRTSPSS
jgi:hypothetical protein